MVAQEDGLTTGHTHHQLPQQLAETQRSARDDGRRESFREPRSWAAKWCGFGLFGPSHGETQAGHRAGEC